jgi:hypothetical protein
VIWLVEGLWCAHQRRSDPFDERLLLGVNDEKLEVLDIWDQELDAEAAIPRSTELRAHVAAQVFALPPERIVPSSFFMR